MSSNSSTLEDRREQRKLRANELRNTLDNLKLELKSGLTLANKNCDGWAILLPDPSLPGKFRAQLFDAKGFISHHAEESLEKALEEAFSWGYRVIDNNALDRVSLSIEWSRGMAIQAVRDQYNYGKLSWEELFEQVKNIDKKFKDAV